MATTDLIVSRQALSLIADERTPARRVHAQRRHGSSRHASGVHTVVLTDRIATAATSSSRTMRREASARKNDKTNPTRNIQGYKTHENAAFCIKTAVANTEWKADWAEGCKVVNICMNSAKKACDKRVKCWGFAFNPEWGVQLYKEEAVDKTNGHCSREGLREKEGWTTYEKSDSEDEEDETADPAEVATIEKKHPAAPTPAAPTPDAPDGEGPKAACVGRGVPAVILGASTLWHAFAAVGERFAL
eukprot:TRINITY_DN71161_c0_g1_i1.p1 TRINITY_DN71161_c0_g1~~TRINITY_DN71161_c0_g1_i1.p1  ORF type:complete len:285 (+),score=47.64 TRINITY_DN71161_c0_g1_i1:118-855(+)